MNHHQPQESFKCTQSFKMMGLIFVACFSLMQLLACDANNPTKTQARNRKISSQLIQLDSIEMNALFYGDTTVLKELLVEDFTLVNEHGKILNKPDLLAKFSKGMVIDTNTTIFVENSETKVYQDGKSAIQTGIKVQETKDRYGLIIFRSRFTNSYIKEQSQWYVTASQLTRIK
jgi:Domain of unknown function (DUF4440)